MTGSRGGYQSCVSLNIILRHVIDTWLRSDGVNHVLSTNSSNGHHGMSSWGRGRAVASLELGSKASHWGTDNVNKSPTLWIRFRWHEACKLCPLCRRVAVGNQVDDAVRHIIGLVKCTECYMEEEQDFGLS